MPFFRIVDCQTFFAEYFCHMVVLLNIILRNGKLPNGKIAEGCCGMTYTHFCCVWSTVENSGAIGATNIFAVWICFESKKCLEITNMKCVIKVVLTQGLNLRPFESSIWLSNRILRIKTHTLAISWVCISVCPRSYLISKTDSPWVNIRQNWFIFTAWFRTKSLSRNFRDVLSLTFYTCH